MSPIKSGMAAKRIPDIVMHEACDGRDEEV